MAREGGTWLSGRNECCEEVGLFFPVFVADVKKGRPQSRAELVVLKKKTVEKTSSCTRVFCLV